jgi:LEA14-like dessication related protein
MFPCWKAKSASYIFRRGLGMKQRFFMMIRMLVPVFLLAGCAHLWGTPDTPRVNIASLTPKEMKLFEQVFFMDLRVMNPGDKELVINGLAFNLEVNGQAFARGVSNESFTVGPFATHVVQVEAITSLASLLGQIVRAQKEEFSGFTYRLKGYFHSGSSGSRIPFDEQGEFQRSP